MSDVMTEEEMDAWSAMFEEEQAERVWGTELNQINLLISDSDYPDIPF